MKNQLIQAIGENNSQNLCLTIKKYNVGGLSQHLHANGLDDGMRQ